jgi:parvulin-like peptidyl-prolyl isomerase
MRSKRHIALFGICLIFLFAPAASAVVVDGIAVVVNKDAILVSEINEALMPLMQEYRQKYSGKELQKHLANLREMIIDQAIETRLVLQVAKEKGFTASEKDIDTRVDMVKSRFPSEEEFLKALSTKGLTLHEYRDQVAEQVLVQQTIQREVGQDVKVLDNEIRDYYDSHLDEFVTVPRVKLAQIFLAVPGDAGVDAVEAKRQLANQLHVLLEDGMEFGELAEHYSEGPYRKDGGLIGVVGKNEILPELEKNAFALQTGEISPVIQTSYGFHILKALEALPERKIGFDEAKPLIEEHLRDTKRNDKYKEWIQELRSKAYIDVKL